MKILGIDPGLSGGLVLLDEGQPLLRLVMPTITVKASKREYDMQAIVNFLQGAAPGICALEKIHAMPGQGVSSMFSMGLGYGVLRGMFAGLSLRYTLVTPQAWQKVMFAGLPKTDTYAMATLVCQQLWPQVDWRASQKCKKAHEGLVDAAMIAEFCRRTIKG